MKTRDHVVPKSQGGVWTVDACLRCNAAKKDMSLDAFRRLRGGIEFFGEMRERLVNEATSWIVEGPEDENVVHRQMHRVVPQDISRPFYEATVDLSKITQHTRGAKTKQGTAKSPLRSDLLGVKFGVLTVVGRIAGKWVVECMCCAIEHRSTKAVLNPANKSDSCEDCRRPVTKLRSDIWHEFGVEFEYDDVFQHIYGDFLQKVNENSQEQEYTPPNGEASNQDMSRRPKNKTDEKLIQTEREILHVEEAVLRREDEILHVEEENHRILEEIERRLRHPQLTHSIRINFSGAITMDTLTLNVGQSSTGTITPLGADGVTPSGGTVSAASFSIPPDPSFTAVDNGDGTCLITGVAASAAPVTGTASCTVTDPDGAVSTFSTSFTITVSAVAPPPPVATTTSIGVSFSTPA